MEELIFNLADSHFFFNDVEVMSTKYSGEIAGSVQHTLNIINSNKYDMFMF